MNVDPPLAKGFTVYSKSGCSYCTKIKNALREKHLLFKEVDCDAFLKEDKPAFLSSMAEQIGKPYSLFPMVFHDGVFLGGCTEALDFVEKWLLSFDELF